MMNHLSLREELESALKQCKIAMDEVNSDAERSVFKAPCQCSHNAYAKAKYGFAVGYCYGSINRILNAMKNEPWGK